VIKLPVFLIEKLQHCFGEGDEFSLSRKIHLFYFSLFFNFKDEVETALPLNCYDETV
jgi:hypothetical protein